MEEVGIFFDVIEVLVGSRGVGSSGESCRMLAGLTIVKERNTGSQFYFD